MPASRMGIARSLLLAGLAAAATMALVMPAPAAALDDCATNPADPACMMIPTSATLTVTPPTAGRVSSAITAPAIDCGPGGTNVCTATIPYFCFTGPASCPAFAPTVTLNAIDAPTGKLPQWSSNCTPQSGDPYACSLKIISAATVSLTWVDDPADRPPAPPATTTTDPGADQPQPQQQTPVIASAKASCKVPKLLGKTLKAAKKALKRSNCALGKVKKKTVKRGKAGRVLAQAVKAGVTKPNGTKVALTLSRRRA